MATNECGNDTELLVKNIFMTFFVITPLSAVFWYGGDVMLDELLDKCGSLLNKLVGAKLEGTADVVSGGGGSAHGVWLFTVGVGLHVAAEVCHQQIASNAPASRAAFVIYSRGYTYLLAVGCMFHDRGTEFVYETVVSTGEKQLGLHAASPLEVAAAMLALLLVLRATRNAISLPLGLTVDRDDRWFDDKSSLSFFEGHVPDALFSVSVVATIITVFTQSVSSALDTLLPGQSLAVYTSLGYTALLGLLALRCRLSGSLPDIERQHGQLGRLAAEDLFVVVAVIVVVALMKGVSGYVELVLESLAHSVGLPLNTVAVFSHFAAFVVLASLGVSKSLASIGQTKDGEGVDFSIDYWQNN